MAIAGRAADNNLNAGIPHSSQIAPKGHPSFIQRGMHSDIHKLHLVGGDLFVSCNGGIFMRNDATGQVDTLNAGLATIEPTYMSSHPTIEAAAQIGTQDNGFVERVGDTLWKKRDGGDGGGNAYHPTVPTNTINQYTNSKCRLNSVTALGNPSSKRKSGPVRNGWGR